MKTKDEILGYVKPVRNIIDEKKVYESVSERTGMKYATVSACARETLMEIQRRLDAGEEVQMGKFGRFGFSLRRPVISHDLSTGGKVYTPARSVIKFFPCPNWRWRNFYRSCVIPDELPEGVSLSQRLTESPAFKKFLGEQGKTNILDKLNKK